MLHKVWSYVRESFDTLIALVISIATGIAGIFGWSDNSYVLAAIATTLGLLAFSLTRDRIHREELIRETHNISTNLQSIVHNRATSSYFFMTRRNIPNISTKMEKVSQLDLMGASLHSLAVHQRNTIKNIKESGGRVRFLITNPDNLSLQQQLAMIFYEVDTAESHIALVNTALNSLLRLVGESNSGGSLEVRVTNQLPFGYIAFDGDKKRGEIQVEWYLKGPAEHNPIFMLYKETDTNWYSVYQNQFEDFWNNADVYISR